MEPAAPGPAGDPVPEAGGGEEKPAPAEAPGPRLLRGRLVDVNGDPVRGARIRVVSPATYRIEERRGEKVLEFDTREARDVSGRVFRMGGITGETHEDGRFYVGMQGGEGRSFVFFAHPEATRLDEPEFFYVGGDAGPITLRYLRRVFLVLEADRSGEADLGVVRVPAAGSIYGTLADTEGRPRPGRPVWCWPEGVGRSVRELARKRGDPPYRTLCPSLPFGGLRRITTGADGGFELTGVPPGTYLVCSGEPERWQREVGVIEGTATGPLNLTVAPPKAPEIVGRVVDARTGEAVQARRVTITFEVTEASPREAFNHLTPVPAARACSSTTRSPPWCRWRFAA